MPSTVGVVSPTVAFRVQENFLEGVENATVFTRVNSLNTVVFAYTNQFNAPQLLGEISEPKELNMAAAARWSSLLSLVLYSMASVLGRGSVF